MLSSRRAVIGIFTGLAILLVIGFVVAIVGHFKMTETSWSKLQEWYRTPSDLCPHACQQIGGCQLYESLNQAALQWDNGDFPCSLNPCTCPYSPCNSCPSAVLEYPSTSFCFASSLTTGAVYCESATSPIEKAFERHYLPMVIAGGVLAGVAFLSLIIYSVYFCVKFNGRPFTPSRDDFQDMSYQRTN